jgi:hypothetical protein
MSDGEGSYRLGRISLLHTGIYFVFVDFVVTLLRLVLGVVGFKFSWAWKEGPVLGVLVLSLLFAFIGGVLVAFIYNLFAGLSGGIAIRLDRDTESVGRLRGRRSSLPPPRPRE